MTDDQTRLESALSDFDSLRRKAALNALCEMVRNEAIRLPAASSAVNLHSHTFFSYNGYGYSPTAFAWNARTRGLTVAGIVDFDVLDGVDEFLEAADQLGLKATAGMETRIYVPEFGTREINSPGEPGIAYYMGVGFTTSNVESLFLRSLKTSAQQRNRAILERVNSYVDPVVIDFRRDVLPLTPNGNPTERHLCAAYAAKAERCFSDSGERAAFWAGKLGVALEGVSPLLQDGPNLQGLIRSKLMKSGGVGYVKPDGPAFPRLREVNDFILSCGAIPTYAWLDGTTPGEQAVDELLDLLAYSGTAAINIIPDRNWNVKDPLQKKVKVDNLYKVVEIAQARAMPIIVGTEMNAHGQRFVDDFTAPELLPLLPAFQHGAHIAYGHTVMQKYLGLGYMSAWAQRSFATLQEKNTFYAWVGETVSPMDAQRLASLGREVTVEGLRGAVCSVGNHADA
ncbi:MAG: hypothetical protein HY706_12915 [Candidatus Hydrogenedentes bacterium]|nr:hypothetical protein [Candidatus Hydrogenedentota bacterium]